MVSHMASHMASTWHSHGLHLASMLTSREKHASMSCVSREPIGTAKAPFSGYLADEGVTRGVATEVNV